MFNLATDYEPLLTVVSGAKKKLYIFYNLYILFLFILAKYSHLPAGLLYNDFAATYVILITIFVTGSNGELDVHGTTGDIFYEHQHVDFSQTIKKDIIPATDYQFHVSLEIRYNGLEISDEVSLASENRDSKELKIECKSKPPTPYGNYFPSYLVIMVHD